MNRHFFLLFLVMVIGEASAWVMGAPPPYAAEPPAQVYELDEIIALALERNPAVAGAEGIVEQSRGQRIAAGAYPNPSIIGQGGRGVIRDPSNGFVIGEYTVLLGQPLEWPGKRAARKRAAAAAAAGASAGMEEVQLNLIAEVKIAFYELLLAQQQLDIAKQNLDIVEDVLRIVKARVRSGEGPQFEAVKAEVEVLKAKQVVTRAQNAVRVGRVRLDTLAAGALGPAFAIRGDFESFRDRVYLDDLTARALEQHPTLRRLSKLVERADHNVMLERESRVPNVTVNGGYWREAGREALTASLSVPTPLWYQRQGEITSALGAKRREEAEWLRARNELLREVNQHFKDAETAAEQIAVFQKGLLKQAKEALRIAQFSFKQGAASLLEVLDAQRVQQQILQAYAQARFDLAIALTRLQRSVGGRL